MIIVHDSFSAYLPGEMKVNVSIPYSKNALSTTIVVRSQLGAFLTQIIVILLRLNVAIFFSPTTKALT